MLSGRFAGSAASSLVSRSLTSGFSMAESNFGSRLVSSQSCKAAMVSASFRSSSRFTGNSGPPDPSANRIVPSDNVPKAGVDSTRA